MLRRQPIVPRTDRLPPERLAELQVALKKGGWSVRDDEAAVAKLCELRGLYEPFAQALADFLRLDLPAVSPAGGGPDNWQTSAGMRRAEGFAQLSADPRDEHFE